MNFMLSRGRQRLPGRAAPRFTLTLAAAIATLVSTGAVTALPDSDGGANERPPRDSLTPGPRPPGPGGLFGPSGPPRTEPAENCGVTGPCVADALPYVHPLQGSALTDGRVPVIQAKDSATGKRFAITEGAGQQGTALPVKFSGVEELDVIVPGTAEVQSHYEAKLAANDGLPRQPLPPEAGRKIAADIVLVRPAEILSLVVRIEEPGGPTLSEQIEIAVARDEITTYGEFRQKRGTLLAQQRTAVAAAQQPIVDAITALGGSVVSLPRNLYGLNISLPAGQVEALAANPAILNIDLDTEATEDIDGNHMRRGMQLPQFINHGWDGENGPAAAISFAVIEAGEMHDGHVGFREGNGNQSVRLRGRYNCDSDGCGFTSNFLFPVAHATAVNSIVWGDLTDEQDTSWPNELDQKRRSGYAGEAWGYAYEATGKRGFRNALDHVIGRNYLPHVVNASWSFYSDDPQCLGETALSKDANDLFQNGILLIKTAGNNGFGNSNDCRVGSPGSAIGVMTVGGHGNSTTSNDYQDVKDASIYNSSSLGGVSQSEGKNRSIVDLTAYACREKMFDIVGGYSTSGCGTSYSAPAVAAAAINYIDFYKDTYSDFIDNPGILFTHLMLMADRQGQGGKFLRGFDELWGAGRLKMRKINNDGLDAPWEWRTNYTCVDDGEKVIVPVNGGNPLSTDVDYLKAVAWWFDPRHERGLQTSDIDLTLKTTSGTILESSLDWDDNKERVFSRNVGGETVQLELYGYDVPTDDTSCGANSMKVYYGFFYEDGDRDDADGPGELIDTE